MVGFLIVMTARIRVSVDSLPFTFYNCVISTNEVGECRGQHGLWHPIPQYYNYLPSFGCSKFQVHRWCMQSSVSSIELTIL